MRGQSTRPAAAISVLCAGYAVCALCAMAAGAGRAFAGDAVSDMSLEQLMDEPVTSVSKKETKLSDSAAAIAVVTHEDIQRLGITNLPDALRLVPGLDVAQISSNQWAVSSRGFNGVFARDLLVLIDGRSVYTPASGGVFWNAQDVMVEDIDRIEVIRGPGTTLWGSNAVNGVINVITKRSNETQGTLVSATDGTGLSRYAARYGGDWGSDFSFRTYLQYRDQQGLTDSTRQFDTGAWETIRGGFRIDGDLSASDTLTVQGDGYGGNATNSITLTSLDPPGNPLSLITENNEGSDLVGRWTHAYSMNSTLTLQSYVDHAVQGDGAGIEHRETYDVDLQHRILFGNVHDVVWGAGFRFAAVDERPSSFNIAWTPAERDIRIWNAFVQDEMTLYPDRLRMTWGAKLESTSLAGSDALPNFRVSFTPDTRQTMWGAVSRAAGAPDLFDLDGRANVAASQSANGTPILVSLLPNPNLTWEELFAYELGYRFTPNPAFSLDLSSFINHYRHLITESEMPVALELNPAPAHLLLAAEPINGLSASTRGLESAAHWQAMPGWQLAASYTWLSIDARSSPAIERQSPRQQFQVRSYLDLPFHLEFNAALYYVDAVTGQSSLANVDIAPYVRADVGLIFKPAGGWSIGIWGQNLGQREDAEFPDNRTPLLNEIPRSVLAKLVGTF